MGHALGCLDLELYSRSVLYGLLLNLLIISESRKKNSLIASHFK